MEKYYAAAFHRIFHLNLNSYFVSIMRNFGSWEEAWNSLKDPKRIGVPERLSEKYIIERKKTDPMQIAEELEKKSINLITRNDPSFSKLLLQISSIPCILYYCGNISILNSKSLAVIGSRKATQYGLGQAKEMASQLARYGLTIISGLARGIDAAAHQGALEVEGNTIAVIGSALDMPYPRENMAIFQRIKADGLVISEFPLGTGPFKQNFPIRNRIISGISLGTFIIEAQAKSGTLITCDYALEQGKEVFALPGPVTSANSIGTLRLIQNGAKLVIYPEDILEELGYEYKQEKINQQKNNVADLNQEEKDVLGFFLWEPVHIDKLLVNNDRQQVLYETLIKLEIKGLIKQLPGKYYVRV